MGNGAAKYNSAVCDEVALQGLKGKILLSMDAMVAHYTPSSFPLIPVVNKNTKKLLKESWNIMVNKNVCKDGNSTSGITLLYNEFYERLGILDTTGRFEAVLTRNVEGVSMLQAKGAILIRILKYVLSVEEDSKETQRKLYLLGKAHSEMDIRPWQYSIFVQTLLLTISSRLGTAATDDVMSAWVNMFAFVMKGMLPSAIQPYKRVLVRRS